MVSNCVDPHFYGGLFKVDGVSVYAPLRSNGIGFIAGAIDVTCEQADSLGLFDKANGDMRRVCVFKFNFVDYYNRCVALKVVSPRKLDNVSCKSYAMFGRVSVGGERYEVHSSSQLFNIDGAIYDIPVFLSIDYLDSADYLNLDLDEA